MSFVTQESNAPGDVTLVTRNVAPLSNAERQRLYRQRQKAKAEAKTTAPDGTKPKKPRPGGHKLRRLDPNRPKRQCAPTPTATAPPRPRGGQTVYSDDIADEILWRLAHGETLNRIIASDPDRFPARSTITSWVQNRHDFAERFARARDLMFEHWADNLAEVGDAVRDKPEQVPAARLDSENKRWLLSRLKPSLYSEKFQADITSGGKPLASASDLDIAKALAHALMPAALPAPEPIEVEAVPVETKGGSSS